MPRRLPSFRQSLILQQKSPPSSDPLRTSWRQLPTLTDASIPTFKGRAFMPEQPFLLPRGTFSKLPAIDKWFQKNADTKLQTIDHPYLKEFGDAMLPVEYTTRRTNGETHFQRGNAPFAIFLAWVMHATSSHRAAETISQRLYIAQASLSLLPLRLHNDVPAPQIVEKAGKGDIYDSSLWLGIAPTYTPLHRDPNPNLFVQLAGTKRIKIADPKKGNAMFENVKQTLIQEGSTSTVSAKYRGDEMMHGREGLLLEQEVWDKAGREEEDGFWEAEVGSGDGLFIPTGFWHSIKGIGDGVNGSVNWWFR